MDSQSSFITALDYESILKSIIPKKLFQVKPPCLSGNNVCKTVVRTPNFAFKLTDTEHFSTYH